MNMKKLSYVIATCALIGSSFILSSCDEDDDREIKKDDGNTVVVESKTTDVIVFDGDTFRLPVKVTNKGNDYYAYITSDKDKIFLSLFDQTAKLSEYGNFSLDRNVKPFEFGVTKLKDATFPCEDENKWNFVGKRASFVASVYFDSDSTSISTFHFSNAFPLDENHVIQLPILGPVE